MINIMNIELMATIIGTVVTIVALAITIHYARKDIVEGNKNTQKILERIGCAIDKIASHSAVDLSSQGIEIAENIESWEEAEKLGEVVKYNPRLKVAYYRPKRTAV